MNIILISSFILVNSLKEVIIKRGAINISMFIDTVPIINLVFKDAICFNTTAGIARSTKLRIKVGAACIYSSIPKNFKYKAKGYESVSIMLKLFII